MAEKIGSPPKSKKRARRYVKKRKGTASKLLRKKRLYADILNLLKMCYQDKSGLPPVSRQKLKAYFKVIQAQNAAYAKQFHGGVTQGSRKVNLYATGGAGVGATVGGVLGAPGIGGAIGSSIGGGIGALADKYGGPMAATLANHYSAINSLVDSLANSVGPSIAKKFLVSAFAQHLTPTSDNGPSQ